MATGKPGEWATTRDGRELYLERTAPQREANTPRPTVVFEAGMGASRNAWGAVAPLVAEAAPTVAYDRSGLGKSPPDPQHGDERKLDRLVDDHLDLLTHVGGSPVVVVAHSWGGPIARAAAAREPGRVAGLVLVDQTDELCELYFAPSVERQTRLSERVMPLAARLGLIRLAVKRLASSLPEPAASAMREEDGTVAAVRAHQAEAVASIADLRRLHGEPLPVPEIPITLVSGLKASRLGRRRRDALVAAHRARADAAPRGRHVGAERSGHFVPFAEPRLVADEVLRVVDIVTQGA